MQSLSTGSSSSEDEILVYLGTVAAGKPKKCKHKTWVRGMFRKREEYGTINLVRETAMADEKMFFRYMRMSPYNFEYLLSLVAPNITKQTTNFRKPIPPQLRLSVTLRHLATGESHISLSLQYRIGRQTVSKIIPDICKAIYEAIAPIYLKKPSSPEEWLQISQDFNDRWNLPHVVGALDGKHVRVVCPSRSGSLYRNYKGYFSMVLMAICDANYRFLMFDFGQYGSNNDSGVLLKSKMGQQLEQGQLQLPAATRLDGCDYDPLPYYFVGDEIFPLTTYLMRPYPGSSLTMSASVYNYRHSRARRVIENTFGILCARWRIFFTPINAKVDNIEAIVTACIALHNFSKTTDNPAYCPTGYVDRETANGDVIPGNWRRESQSSSASADGNLGDCVSVLRGRRTSGNALHMRDCL